MGKKQYGLKSHFINGGNDLIYHVITIAFDLILLFAWAYAQYCFQKLKPEITERFDQITIIVFQVLFFISPLVPIVICIYKHIIIMVHKARKEIKDSRDEGKR